LFADAGATTLPSVNLTPEQILDAARQLPETERRRLVVALQEQSTPQQARARARKLRRGHRLPTKQRERLGELLAKGNAGALSAAESVELDRLVEIFEEKTHDLALAIGRPRSRPAS
jgi:acyl-CoA reductase-like NAD-dependent aldehyde dehydrogenase